LFNLLSGSPSNNPGVKKSSNESSSEKLV
jgi:hypothetical protein